MKVASRRCAHRIASLCAIAAAAFGAAAPPAAAATPMPPTMPGMATPGPRPTPTPFATPTDDMAGMQMTPAPSSSAPRSTAASSAAMRSETDLADAMSQDGSGTSWIPASTQMFGFMRAGGRDMQMMHFALFPRYVDTGSARGDRRLDAPNWFMLMGTHELSPATQLGYTAMLSADALAENETGYPLLFQTGETAHGVPLHDRQHPHDLFSELAVDYSARLSGDVSAYVYLGYPGEPALGPPAYMHRRIAYDMADAPIGHHWQDSTHIQFGVATLGIEPTTNLKVEASTFTGREPNEIRSNFDPIRLDSSSERLSWNPNAETAAEVSYGFIKSPESNDPLIDQHRLVASLLLNRALGPNRNWYNGLVYGSVVDSDGTHTDSYLAETDYQRGANTLYGRFEVGTRSARDLVIPNVAPSTIYTVGAYAFGGVHDLTRNAAAVDMGLGAQFTVGSKSAALAAYYGASTPLGYQVFFRIRPPDMAQNMASMDGMRMSTPR